MISDDNEHHTRETFCKSSPCRTLASRSASAKGPRRTGNTRDQADRIGSGTTLDTRLAPCHDRRVGRTARSHIPFGLVWAFSVRPPSEPGVHRFDAPGSSAIYAACAIGLACPLLPRSRRTLSTTAASCISHASWPGAVHRLCPFALWTGSPGHQIGRPLPLRLLRALRRHRTRVP